MPILETVVILLGCGVAVFTDLQSRRIPNAIPIVLAVFGLALAATHGWIAVVSGIGILIGVLGLGTFIFNAGWLGGGDVKLMAAVGATLGAQDILAFLLYTSVAGGLLALAYTIVTGKTRTVFGSVINIATPMLYKGTVALAPTKPTKLPYACAIGGGVLAVVLSHSVAPFLRLPI